MYVFVFLMHWDVGVYVFENLQKPRLACIVFILTFAPRPEHEAPAALIFKIDCNEKKSHESLFLHPSVEKGVGGNRP